MQLRMWTQILGHFCQVNRAAGGVTEGWERGGRGEAAAGHNTKTSLSVILFKCKIAVIRPSVDGFLVVLYTYTNNFY